MSPPEPELLQVCLACGKIKGEHRGWDVSCELNSETVKASQVERDENGRVTAIVEEPRQQ